MQARCELRQIAISCVNHYFCNATLPLQFYATRLGKIGNQQGQNLKRIILSTSIKFEGN